jgi:hypothetical protein
METECPVLAKVCQTTELAVVTRIRIKGGPGTAAELSTVASIALTGWPGLESRGATYCGYACSVNPYLGVY